MESEKVNLIRSELQLLQDTDFESIFNSPWKKYPSILIKEELIRRLKLRADLSQGEKRVLFVKIINDVRLVQGVEAFNQFNEQISQIDVDESKAWLPKRNARLEEMTQHHQQLAEFHRSKNDPFEGKNKPGDWRPDGTEVCPVCSGVGKGLEGRICSKCSGRGFTRK